MTAILTDGVIRELLPLRPEDGHKGSFGHVLILAGSSGFAGAVKLSVEGALRSGVGLVTAGVPESILPFVAVSLVEAMTLSLPATEGGALSQDAIEPALKFAATKQAVMLGPGMSRNTSTQCFVSKMVAQCPVPLVADADGLNCLSDCMDSLQDAEAPRLLTPHPGEMARLMNVSIQYIQSNRQDAARTLATRYRCVVVLKGHQTVIADDNGNAWVNSTGNVGMATGGTGDVLAGLIGGLLAQGINVKDAALIGVYIHGLAGDIAAVRKTSRGMLARDLAEALPEAWRTLEWRKS